MDLGDFTLIYVKIIKIILTKIFNLCLFYDNFMLIYEKNHRKKMFSIGQTDTRSTQNHSSEPHKKTEN